MNQKLKQAIQVLVSLGIAVWIFWLLYRDIEFSKLWEQVKSSNWFWISLSLVIAWMGYWIRGWRWSLLINSDDNTQVSPNRSYHAVMIGYLVNMLVPRAGEVARCGMLTRSNGISLGHLIGTVIFERSIDLLFLISTIFLAFIIENQLFVSLANELVDVGSLSQKIISNLTMISAAIVVFLLTVYFLFRRFRSHGLVNKLQEFFRQIFTGFKSIQTLKNPQGFWASSVLIWIIYFLTMYTVSQGIQSTANLTSGEVLLVMVMGSIGMVAPVQGGIGTFHALVAYILIQLGISETDGKIFAAIIHGTQVILVLMAGMVSWLWMMKIPVWNKPEEN
jgi:glycosyltransferase 2 family protein